MFYQIDAPVSPGNKGNRWFLNGLTDDIHRQYRTRFLSVEGGQLSTVAKKLESNAYKSLLYIFLFCQVPAFKADCVVFSCVRKINAKRSVRMETF